MRGRIIKVDPDRAHPGVIRTIVRTLRQGGLIVYPTDTFYGLGADCFSAVALSRIYEVKGRPLSKALPVLVADAETVRRLAAEIPPDFDRLAAAFWPGPLTLILKAAFDLPAELVGPDRTIGVRLPAVVWLRDLIRAAGFPVVATSANISGEGEIDTGEEAIREFGGKVDLIVDGGKTTGGRPSTVIDLSSGEPILRRAGAIPRAQIDKVVLIK
jgi:L-threonylcarbamoyladenylate synthase